MTVVSITRDDHSLTVGLAGPLDDELGEQLLEITKVALAVTPVVVIDLAAVTQWTCAGLHALSECAELGALLPADEGHAHPNL